MVLIFLNGVLKRNTGRRNGTFQVPGQPKIASYFLGLVLLMGCCLFWGVGLLVGCWLGVGWVLVGCWLG
jgi:hypothetical protein